MFLYKPTYCIHIHKIFIKTRRFASLVSVPPKCPFKHGWSLYQKLGTIGDYSINRQIFLSVNFIDNRLSINTIGGVSDPSGTEGVLPTGATNDIAAFYRSAYKPKICLFF
jgi:hypothetical protein